MANNTENMKFKFKTTSGHLFNPLLLWSTHTLFIFAKLHGKYTSFEWSNLVFPFFFS